MLAYLPYFTATASNVNYGWWGHDIGGHMFHKTQKATDPELYTRWLQYGVFTPIFKTHSTKDPRIERCIWCFPDHMFLMRDAIRLRYTLAPYIYNAARENYDTGVGMCRPMYYDYPESDKAYETPEQFMFGNDILATTITQPVDSITGLAPRTIWFPEGAWFDCATGSMYEGGRTEELHYTLAENPHYAKAGSIIPMNPATVKNLQQPCDTLVLTFIPGGDGQLRHYEDDGMSQQYKTNYAVTTVSKKQEGNTVRVRISPREGSFAGASDNRSYELRFPAVFPPKSVKVNGKELAYSRFPKAGEWTYDGYTLAPVIYTATTTCIATPRNAPAPHVRPVMNRFCFHEGLVRHSTARPTPAPVQRPATRLEKRRAPSTYSWVSSTLAAQLGIRPTSAATTGWKKPMLPRRSANTSSPTPSTIRPNTRLNAKMNTKISSVWRRAAFQMGAGLPSSSLCSS